MQNKNIPPDIAARVERMEGAHLVRLDMQPVVVAPSINISSRMATKPSHFGLQQL